MYISYDMTVACKNGGWSGVITRERKREKWRNLRPMTLTCLPLPLLYPLWLRPLSFTFTVRPSVRPSVGPVHQRCWLNWTNVCRLLFFFVISNYSTSQQSRRPPSIFSRPLGLNAHNVHALLWWLRLRQSITFIRHLPLAAWSLRTPSSHCCFHLPSPPAVSSCTFDQGLKLENYNSTFSSLFSSRLNKNEIQLLGVE